MQEEVRQLQEAMQAMQQDAARRAEFTTRQAEVLAQQAGLLTKLQQQQQPQQDGASASHPAPPPPMVPIPREAAHVQESTDVPTWPVLLPIPPQLSKAPANPVDTPFEFKVDPTALKVNKLEELFRRAHGVNPIPDLEDGYIESAVTLPERFKMPHIDRFDGSGDPRVHLHLFSDILKPMGLTTAPKLSLFGRTMSGIAAIWHAKLEDSVKQN